MTWHILCLRGSDDAFRPAIGLSDQVLEVPFGIPGHAQTVHCSVAGVLAQYGLLLSESAEDLLVAAISAYAADAGIPRRYAYDRWTRDFILHLPVSQPARWQRARPVLERLLSFLTGDHWIIQVRPLVVSTAAGLLVPVQKSMWANLPPRADRVCLYSGGLDSFIGALDQLAHGEPVVLVGHHGSGQGPTSIAQRRANAALRQRYDATVAPYFRFWVSPPKIALGVSEITTRGRSLLFLALGDFCITPRNGALGFNQASSSPTSREWDDGVWHREGVTRLTGAAYTLSNRRSSQAASPQEKKASEVLKRLPGCCFSLFLR